MVFHFVTQIFSSHYYGENEGQNNTYNSTKTQLIKQCPLINNYNTDVRGSDCVHYFPTVFHCHLLLPQCIISIWINVVSISKDFYFNFLVIFEKLHVWNITSLKCISSGVSVCNNTWSLYAYVVDIPFFFPYNIWISTFSKLLSLKVINFF